MITTYCGLTRSGKSTMGVKIYRDNPGVYDIFVTSFIGKGCGINCKNGDFEKGVQLTALNYKDLIMNSKTKGIIIDEPEELLSSDLIEFLKTVDKDVVLLVNKYHDSYYENKYISELLTISDKIIDLNLTCFKCGNIATKYIGGKTMYLCDDCFEDEIFIENKIDISMVELELHNFCNRKCSWCIRSKAKSTDVEYMDNSLFRKMVDEISSIPNKISIGISRFSEPMYDSRNLLLKSKYIKEKIPNSFLWISTNGDYLNKDTLEDLKHIDQVKVMDYDNKGIIEILNRLELLGGLSILELSDETISAINLKTNTEFIFEINTKENMIKNWSLRTLGNSLEDPNNIYTTECGNKHSNHKGLSINNKYCTAIGKYIAVDHNGDIFPCPDVSSSFTRHTDDLLMGNVKDGFNSLKFNNYIEGKYSCINCSFNAEIHTCLRNKQSNNHIKKI